MNAFPQEIYLLQSQFSKFISTPSTTTATSTSTEAPDSDLPAFPGSAPPLPPPPPLNIPPSRARRQLAARLALHNKSQEGATGTNGDSDILSTSPEKSSDLARDPFADDDSDDDLEIEGGPSDAWGLPSYDQSGRFGDKSGFEDNSVDDNVGAPSDAEAFSSSLDAALAPLQKMPSHSGSNSRSNTVSGSFVPAALPLSSAFKGHVGTLNDGGINAKDADDLNDGSSTSADLSKKPRSISPLKTGKTGFSSLWPFGHASRGHRRRSVDQRYGNVNRDGDDLENETNDFFDQSDTDSSDDGFDGVGEKEASGAYEGKHGQRNRGRRPSLTTEAKSRTSLDDEDEDIEVVMKKSDVEEATKDNGKGKEVEKQAEKKEDIKAEQKDQDKKI